LTRNGAGKRGPSMLDVAKHAGVSIATVSHVINDKGRVSEGTAKRVRESIAALGFVRNDAARMLATGSTNSIGMVLADLDNSLFVDMAHGAQQGAEDRGYRLLLGNSACAIDRQEDYLRLFDEARVAGVLLAPMEDSQSGIERMRSHGRPIVLLNYQQRGADCCTVLVDNEKVGYLAARHLIEGGRRHLAFLAGVDYYQPVHARREGVRRAVAEATGVSLEEYDTEGIRFDHGFHAGRQILRRASGLVPDGVVAVTDDIGNGLAAALDAESTLRIPQDVAIVGCEGNRAAASGPVILTTVMVAGVDLGQAAVALLLDELSNPDGHRHRTIMLAPSIGVRASSVGALSADANSR